VFGDPTRPVFRSWLAAVTLAERESSVRVSGTQVLLCCVWFQCPARVQAVAVFSSRERHRSSLAASFRSGIHRMPLFSVPAQQRK